jgi:ribosomal protein L28
MVSNRKNILQCLVFKFLGRTKKARIMNSRSHSMKSTKSKKKVNIIKFKIHGRTYNISARGLKTLKKMNITPEDFVLNYAI